MSSSERRSAEQVRGIFDRIARRYDLLNRVISLHLDTYWRKKAVAAALRGGERLVLDLGTGTGDLALAAAHAIGGGRIVGLDFSFEMLRLAMQKKGKDRDGGKIFYTLGSALAPPLGDQSFDAAMTAFVLRNVTDLPLFFSQAYRLLKPGGRLVSLDMFPPSGFPFSLLYSVYFHRLMPWVGACLARDREAYRYLSQSVKEFYPPEAIADMIGRAGFDNVTTRKFLNGAVCLHAGDRPIT
jgi:demethylmenaquinone methyltransferase/2-methoxy-6-polyprenyl-1,4-benzoquinol methylase